MPLLQAEGKEEMNNAGDLNDYMFEQLERLNELDVSDRDALAAEVRRAHAFCEVGQAIVANAKNVIEAQRMRQDYTGDGTPDMPRMLGA